MFNEIQTTKVIILNISNVWMSYETHPRARQHPPQTKHRSPKMFDGQFSRNEPSNSATFWTAKAKFQTKVSNNIIMINTYLN